MAIRILVHVLLPAFLSFYTCKGQDTSVSPLSPMKKKEQETLYSVIQGFIGKGWNGSDLYPDPCGWTPIQGVSCELYEKYWYVTVLNLGPVFDNSLVCTHDAQFPDEIFKLKHLRILSLTGCFLYPTQNPVRLPISNWENLSNSLESLHLRSNPGLVGTIPSSFGCLRKLQSLALIENGLIGELPSSIGNLVRLRQLVLSGNHFVGEIPLHYMGLFELLIFDASRNNLSGALPSTVGLLDSLLKLDLSNNLLEGELPRELGRLKNLVLLDLSHNKFRGGLTGPLQELVSLQHMVMSHNPIRGDLFGIQWEFFQNMETLDFSDMSLTGSVPESMTKMKRLRYLDLSNNNLSGCLSVSLENMPSLRALHLNGNKFTGKLEFSERFYRKMGRRFTAWDNANDLCYIASSMTAWIQVPYGVKPCVDQTSVIEGTSKAKINERGIITVPP